MAKQVFNSVDSVTGADFKQVIRFENQIKTPNTSAGQTESDGQYINTRGYSVKKDGSRQMDQNAPGYDRIINVYFFYTYWRTDLEAFLTKDTAILYNNQTFRIETFERIGEQRRYYKFTASEMH